ncbi:MAG: hypothetical protein IJA47_02525, partial [Oscillospiraceae bacterium]|nr:hypothetical protein [Oscillospiraceae bacterium]
MKRRILGLLLALCMVLSLLPATVLATEGETPETDVPVTEVPETETETSGTEDPAGDTSTEVTATEDVTLTMYYGNGNANQETSKTTGWSIPWTATPGQIYYATTDETGKDIKDVTIDANDPTQVPDKWNIKLDNTKTVAELTLKDADIYSHNTSGKTYLAGVKNPGALILSGEGALKVIIAGTPKEDGSANCTIQTGYASTLKLAMAGGTTFTSEGNCKLSVTSAGTGTSPAIISGIADATVTFENANLVVSNYTKSGS